MFSNQLNRYKFFYYGILTLALVLGIIQLLHNRSLWLDEAALALNLMDRGFAGLLVPLDHYQIAPILFLLISDFFGSLGQYSEISLRIFPLICFIASLPLAYAWSEKISGSKTTALALMAFLAVSLRLLEFSNELKQYMGDFLVANLFIYAAVIWRIQKRKHLIKMIALGLIAVWLSNIAIIMMVSLIIYFFFFKTPSKAAFYRLLLLSSIWMIGFAVYYFSFIANHPSGDHMQNYWEDYFMPLNIFSFEWLQFMYLQTEMLFGKLLSFYPLWPLAAALAVIGVVQLAVKKQWAYLVLLSAPLIIHFSISALHLYPIDTRLTLYLLSILGFMVMYGIQLLANWVLPNFRYKAAFKLGPIAIALIPLILKFPIEKEELKQGLRYVSENKAAGDDMLLDNRAYYPAMYYTRREVMKLNRDNLFSNSGDISRFANDERQEFWVVFSHLYKDESNKYRDEIKIDSLSKQFTIIDSKRFEGTAVYHLKAIN